MNVTVIQIIAAVLGMFPKGFEKRPDKLEIRGIIMTILTTGLLRSARILRSVKET